MIKAVQHAVKTNDPTDWQHNAIGADGTMSVLCTIKFEKHPLLTEDLMEHLSLTLLKETHKAVQGYNEDRHPTEEEAVRAKAITRRIIRKIGMEPH